MSLVPGTRLGGYEVLAKLGEGGMGEVYRARDTKLIRDVAIKILPDLFAHDSERVARFAREAQTLASLNHPNIAQIYGILEEAPAEAGTHDSQTAHDRQADNSGNARNVTDVGAGFSRRQTHLHALVMELVEGDDLSVIIARGAMPLAEALPIAKQMAEALEAAHEQGIVHRDLKPANIKVRADGTVKVLDFGLAKALDPAGTSGSGSAEHSPTMTAAAFAQGFGGPGTQMGMILGTAAYMAPEQARGKAVDKRADIWAFGVVVYEMLTGRRLFPGEEISDTLAAVLRQDVDWQALPASMPPPLAALLRRCLERDPKQRLRDIGEARHTLEDLRSGGAAPASALSSTPAVPVPGRRGLSIPLAAALIVAALAGSSFATRWFFAAPAPAAAGAIRLSIALPEGDAIGESNLLPLAISPDGSRIAYTGVRNGVQQLYLRSLSDAAPVAIVGSDSARSPFFSPDSQWVGFFAQGKVMKTAVESGAVQLVADGAGDTRGGAWGPDGLIYFAPSNASGLFKVASAGGTPVPFTTLNREQGEISHRWPHILPDGRTMLMGVWTGPGPDERSVGLVDLASAQVRRLLTGGDTARYVADGFLTYGRLDTLLAVPWRSGQTDIGNLVPKAMAERPRLENEGSADYAVSTNGTLIYIAGGAERYAQRIVWVDRAGVVDPLPMPERDYESVSLSPDGRRAIVQVREGTMGLWMYDMERRTLSPFATAGGSNQAAVWSRDGRWIAYRGTRKGTRNVYLKAADGTGDEMRLTNQVGVVHGPGSFSPDGEWLVYSELSTLWRVRVRGDRTPQRLLDRANNGQISPDGRWLAYESRVSGRYEVYAQPFPGPGPRTSISIDGGRDPRWSRDGKELFFTQDERMMAVSIGSGSTFSVGTPRELYHGRFRPSPNALTAWDVTADGRRFIRVQQVLPDRPVTRVDVVLNWFAELRSAAAGK
jgi:serine/threonine-protein kinase